MSRCMSALRELKRALDEGLLDPDEHFKYKSAVLNSDDDVLIKWELLRSDRPVSSDLLQPLQSSIRSLLQRPQPSSPATPIVHMTRVSSVNDSRVQID